MTLEVFRRGGVVGIAAIVLDIMLAFDVRENGSAVHAPR